MPTTIQGDWFSVLTRDASELAARAKTNCPVSRALSAVEITLAAKLVKG